MTNIYRYHKKDKIYCIEDSSPSIKGTENDCFFCQKAPSNFRKTRKNVSYTGLENTQICKMTGNFVALEFTIRRRR